MALHPDFPDSPYAILNPEVRWFPADEALLDRHGQAYAAADLPQNFSKEDLCELIRRAGKVPVERNTLYNELRTY